MNRSISRRPILASLAFLPVLAAPGWAAGSLGTVETRLFQTREFKLQAYDTSDFVAGLRQLNVTPHVAQNDTNRRSAIDGRTTRHAGYAVSQQK